MRWSRLSFLIFALLSWNSLVLASEYCMSNALCELSDDEVIRQQYLETFIQLTPNQELMRDRWYHRLNAQTSVYNAPGGDVVRVIDEGFNFVTVVEKDNEWARINNNEWVSTANIVDTMSVVSSFTGFLLPEEMTHTIAWALVNVYPSSSPGAGPSENNLLIRRYTPLVITDTAIMDDGRWYEIGQDLWVHQFNVAKIIPLESIPEEVDTERWVAIDLYEQVLIAYEGNRAVFATLIATGLPRWPTFEGTFNIYFRTQRKHMSWGVVGDDFYALEEVPWTMFFDEGRALHGAYWHDGFGYRRSHGCVNMSITDAKWLYDWVAEVMGTRASADREVGPAVHVYSTGEYNS